MTHDSWHEAANVRTNITTLMCLRLLQWLARRWLDAFVSVAAPLDAAGLAVFAFDVALGGCHACRVLPLLARALVAAFVLAGSSVFRVLVVVSWFCAVRAAFAFCFCRNTHAMVTLRWRRHAMRSRMATTSRALMGVCVRSSPSALNPLDDDGLCFRKPRDRSYSYVCGLLRRPCMCSPTSPVQPRDQVK